MKKTRMKKSVTVLQALPWVASIMTLMPLTATADNLVKCPSPRPKTLSEAQWYACSNKDLNEAYNMMAPLALTEGCGDLVCVQKRADAVYEKLSNSVGNPQYKKDLQAVQIKLKSISTVCGNTSVSPLQCIQDNNLSDSATVGDLGGKSYDALKNLSLGKSAQPAPAPQAAQSNALQRKYVNLNAARDLVWNSMDAKAQGTCYRAGQTGEMDPDRACMQNAFDQAISKLGDYGDTAKVAKYLKQKRDACQSHECWDDAVASARDALDSNIEDVKKYPEVAVSKSDPVSKPSSQQSGQNPEHSSGKSGSTKWADMSIHDRMKFLQSHNDADAQLIVQLQLQKVREENKRGCDTSDFNSIKLPDTSGIIPTISTGPAPDVNSDGSPAGGIPQTGPHARHPFDGTFETP